MKSLLRALGLLLVLVGLSTALGAIHAGSAAATYIYDAQHSSAQARAVSDGLPSARQQSRRAETQAAEAAWGAFAQAGVATNAGSVVDDVALVGDDIVGTSHSGLRPTQDWINPAQVDGYAARLRAGERLQPITVQRLPDGRQFILDGHHRYVASQQTGIPVPIRYVDGTGPVGLPDWSKVSYLNSGGG